MGEDVEKAEAAEPVEKANSGGIMVSAALETLEAAAATEPPVSVMAAHMSLSCAGRMRSASSDGVIIEIPNPPADASFEGAKAAVSFPLAGRSAGFTGKVSEVEEPEDGALLVTIELPEKIRIDEQRAAVRIPVPDETLSAAVMEGESLRAVRAIDVSLQGVLIEFGDGSVPDIEEGHRRMVALKLAKKTVLIEAEVRRRDGARYGFAFIMRDGRPPGLTHIISRLQYIWSAS